MNAEHSLTRKYIIIISFERNKLKLVKMILVLRVKMKEYKSYKVYAIRQNWCEILNKTTRYLCWLTNKQLKILRILIIILIDWWTYKFVREGGKYTSRSFYIQDMKKQQGFPLSTTLMSAYFEPLRVDEVIIIPPE